MKFGSYNADQFRQQLMNYTEAKLTKLGRSVSWAASRRLHFERLGILRGNVVSKRMSCPYFGQMSVRSHRFQMRYTKSAKAPFDRRGGHLPRRNDLKRTIHSLRNAVIGSM